MTRRIVRTAIQLAALAAFTFLVIFFLDDKFRVLPSSIHSHLPAHHPGLVITDVTVKTCSTVNMLSSCRIDGAWHRIEKDLYLGNGWFSRAYVFVERKKEEELQPDDRVLIDLKIGPLDPTSGVKGESNERWESRPAGIWIKNTAKRHASDSNKSLTGVDVLFGPDAVDPREGWEVKDTALLLSSAKDSHAARLSVRRGKQNQIAKPQPRIGSNGKFKILQVSDLHLSTGVGACRNPEPEGYNGGHCEADPRSLDFIRKILDEEKPDLVVLSGDQVNGETAPDAQTAIFKYADLFVERKIPFATIFGNHDDEKTLSREYQMQLIETLPYSLSQAGPDDIAGVGNYYVEILAHSAKHSALTLYLLDTHSYSPDERSYEGYDWIKKNQIDWFKKTAEGLKKDHAEYSHTHMDLAFIHIPLPEYRDAGNKMVGARREDETAPGFNSGFRDALVEQGVVLVSCGHDHVNEYCALNNKGKDDRSIWLCYAGGAGFGGYGGYDGYHRRVRFFDIDMNEARITTYKRVEWGETKSRVDEQIIVDGGRVIGES